MENIVFYGTEKNKNLDIIFCACVLKPNAWEEITKKRENYKIKLTKDK